MTTHAVSPFTTVSNEARTRISADLHEAATHRQRQLELITAAHEAGSDTDPAVLTAQRIMLEQLLKQIRAAQARIDDDTFGQCERCQRTIPTARLEVRPWATTCVECASS